MHVPDYRRNETWFEYVFFPERSIRVLCGCSTLLVLLMFGSCVLTSDTELSRPQGIDEGETGALDVQEESPEDIPNDSTPDQTNDLVEDFELVEEPGDVDVDVDVDQEVTPAGYRVVQARFSWPQSFSENEDGYRIRTNSFGFMATAQSPAENDQYRLRAVHFGN